MKKSFPPIFSLLALGVTLSVNAKEESNWYVGAQYSAQEISSTPDRKFKTVGINVGYQFNPYFSLETRIDAGTSDFSFPFYQDEIPGAEYIEEIETQASLYAKAIYPISKSFKLYALAGLTETRFKITTVGADTDVEGNMTLRYPAVIKDSYNGFSYGLGVSYQLTNAITVFVDYKVLPDAEHSISDNRWKNTSLGINYFF
ncbi:porin family protein [Arsukibacterium perlucidum]|uniref:porin family protein n=1 Tax=Arsukibacterium perlucidum TaxID=368811 RepID=UPI00037FBAF0|nr:porin family protein [Arsukibacterium perlucidum]